LGGRTIGSWRSFGIGWCGYAYDGALGSVECKESGYVYHWDLVEEEHIAQRERNRGKVMLTFERERETESWLLWVI
jgi:hypothetical protein